MPTEPADLDSESAERTEGVTLSLSGGGYRAMVFHIGALWRLNEVGLLGRLKRISSVSGGSITAAYLGLMWSELGFNAGKAANFGQFVEGMRKMADTSVDVGAVFGGIFLPGTISDRVAEAYDAVLFKGKKLADLPDDSGGTAPRFVINATNVQSAVLWRFSRPYMGDYRVGLVDKPDVRLANAVAASSAFPPILSPLTLPIRQPVRQTKGADLNRPPYTTEAILSDGGVYDNLGLETVKRFSTLLVSDAGQKIEPEADPAHDWARHSVRVLNIVDNQVRSLRKRHLIEAYQRGDHTGTYWGIRTSYADYRLQADPLGCLRRDPAPLAAIATRLEKMPRDVQNRLMNWGYAICDAGLRAHIKPELQQQLGIKITPPTGFPFPGEY
jgi:NTE family protein